MDKKEERVPIEILGDYTYKCDNCGKVFNLDRLPENAVDPDADYDIYCPECYEAFRMLQQMEEDDDFEH